MLHGLSVVVAGRLYADQSGQLFSKTLVYTFFFVISRWLIRSKHKVCARGRSMPYTPLGRIIL